MTMSNTAPKTIAEVMELISKLRSEKAILNALGTHLRSFYKKSDAGPPEITLMREDFAMVSEAHIDDYIVRLEERVISIDAELEELQNKPIGGGAPPTAEQPTAPATDKAAEDVAIEEAARSTAKEQKGTASGKPRASGGRPS